MYATRYIVSLTYIYDRMFIFHAVKPPHCFLMQDLLQSAVTSDEVQCPKHDGPVSLELLVSLAILTWNI